jgi:hypothetical protein
MTLEELVDEFYRVCYKYPDRLTVVHTPQTPEDMIVDNSPHSSEWVRWKLLERSKVIVPEFVEFEKEIGCKLPESFKLWHSRNFTLSGDVGFVRLPAIPSNNPFQPLRDKLIGGWIPKEVEDQGFLPFGSDGWWDAGSLCFKTSANIENADYPIYLWDHGWVGTDREFRIVFSNFRKLLECCVHYAGGKLPDYDPRPKGTKGFATIDPEGAGKFLAAEDNLKGKHL